MNELYLGHTLAEYLFMVWWMACSVSIVYCYIRICDLKDELEYHQYLNRLMIGRR